MAYTNDAINGTLHLKLNLTVTAEFEDLESMCQDDFLVSHPTLDSAHNVLKVTAGWFLPKKKQSIKQHLEEMLDKFPNNLNVIANLIQVYNSHLLVTKSRILLSKLTDLTKGDSSEVKLRKSRALAERAYVLVADVASQEIKDDTHKLTVAIEWFQKALELGKSNGMTEVECCIWNFFRAKAKYALENRNRYNDNKTEERSTNFTEMLTGFSQVYLYEESNQTPQGTDIQTPQGTDMQKEAVYKTLKALALAYLTDAFSISNAADRGENALKWDIPELFKHNETLQSCHVNPRKAYNEALKLADNYKIKNRFARAFMNWGSKYFDIALDTVLGSISQTKRPIMREINWFGYATCLQIYCKRYLSCLLEAKKKFSGTDKIKQREGAFEAAKSNLRKACAYADDCPYRSASTLIDIADIYYYLGVNPETEEAKDEKYLEKSLEYLMIARERVEGYKNPRTHARLAHCLYALGSWKPAIDCIKLAMEMEQPGYKKNFKNLCKYMLEKREDIDAKHFASLFQFAQKKYVHIEQDKKMTEFYETLKELSKQKSQNLAECDLYSSYKDAPEKARNDGYQYDFLLLSSEEDKELALNFLYKLESQQPTPYKGFFPDRDTEGNYSIFYALNEAVPKSKKILVIVTSQFLLSRKCMLELEDILYYFRDGIPSQSSIIDVTEKPSISIIPIMMEQDCYLPFGASLMIEPMYCNNAQNISDANFCRLIRELVPKDHP